MKYERAKRKRVAFGNTFLEEKLNSTICKITKGFSQKTAVGLGEISRPFPNLS